MIFLLLFLLILPLWRLERQTGDCLSKDQTSAVNGFFVAAVFLCHAYQSLLRPLGYDFLGRGDARFIWLFDSLFGGRLVVTFLAFSGFGLYEQIKRFGMPYVAQIPVKRCLVTYLNFAVAVAIFAVFDVCLRGGGLKRIAWAFTGFTSLGNSNWYIVAIIFCYFFSWLSIKLCQYFNRSNVVGLVVLTALVLGFEWVLKMFGKSASWWNTMLVFPFGAWLSYGSGYLRQALKSCRFAIGCGAMFAFWAINNKVDNLWLNNVGGCLFVLVILLITTYFQIKNPLLAWLGNHVFPIYIYQKLFFLIIVNLHPRVVSQMSVSLYTVLSFVLVVGVACFYPWFSFKFSKGKLRWGKFA